MSSTQPSEKQSQKKINQFPHQQLLFFSSLSPSPFLLFSVVLNEQSGYQPSILIFDVTSRQLLADLKGHRFGVGAMSFDPISRYLVSVGFEHDKHLFVWDWRKEVSLNGAGNQSMNTPNHHKSETSSSSSDGSSQVKSRGKHPMSSSIIACNKISSKVFALSFALDGSFFVTVGVKHCKFWFWDNNKGPKTLDRVSVVSKF